MGALRGLLHRVVVAVAREVLAGEGPQTTTPLSQQPAQSPQPTQTRNKAPAPSPTPPSPTPTPLPPPPPSPYSAAPDEDDGWDAGGDAGVEEVAKEEVLPEEEVEPPSPRASSSATTASISVSAALLRLLDAPPSGALPLPRRPVQKEDEEDDAYETRLLNWRNRVAAAAPTHATLRELAERPSDRDIVFQRIRPYINPVLMSQVVGLDTKAALPIFMTDMAQADARLRCFPASGTMQHIAAGHHPDIELTAAMAAIGWHLYGAEYNGVLIYVFFAPVSVSAAPLSEAKRVCGDAAVSVAEKWPLLKGVPVIATWQRWDLMPD